MSSVETQGMRVHRLANLGGLVVIAGLEHLESPLLLGCLMQLQKQIDQFTEHQLLALKEIGLQKLRERKSEKRVFHERKESSKSWPQLVLQESEIKKLIIKLHGRLPALTKDLVPELLRLMR